MDRPSITTCLLYTSQYNPVEIANNLRRNNGSIPGFRPGKPTSDFLTRTLNKITLMGAIFLACLLYTSRCV